jgi:hypothetical protein
MHRIWKTLVSVAFPILLTGKSPESTCSEGSHVAVCQSTATQDTDHLSHPDFSATNYRPGDFQQVPPAFLGLLDENMPVPPRQHDWWSASFWAHRLIMEAAANDECPLGVNQTE